MRVLMICPELPTEDNPGSMAPAARQFESLEALGVEVDRFDMRGPRVVKYGTAVAKLGKSMRRADLVHSHFGYCGWLGLMASRIHRLKLPTVMSYMGDDLLGTPYNNQGDLEWASRQAVKLNKWVANRFDQVIVKSQEMACVLAPIQSSVIPNGVDIERFQPKDRSEARSELGIKPDSIVALFPGNPDNPRKGFDLARSATELLEKQSGVSVDLRPLWNVAPDDVPSLMNASDFMFMTSFIEGSPNVVKEAMACNVPIVAVDVGDVSELLEQVEGNFVRPRDPHALAEAAASVLARNSVSGGRRRICDLGLDLESVARRVIRVYEQAIQIQAQTPLGLLSGEVVATSGKAESLEV